MKTFTTTETTTLTPEQTLAAALKLARGSHQRAILTGRAMLSGSDLRGTAKSYIGKYRASANAIMARCAAAGLAVSEQIGGHNRRDVVIGTTIFSRNITGI